MLAPGWSGSAYVIFDPVTGDGAFKIGGGKKWRNALLVLCNLFVFDNSFICIVWAI